MRHPVLLIEDNEQNRYLETYLLEIRGYEVIHASDGREGIRLAVKIIPSLILLDIQLPVMDGYTVASELRKHPELNHIPIVAVTSYAMAGDREKTTAYGCTGYIEKPINPVTFVTELEQFLQAGCAFDENAHHG